MRFSCENSSIVGGTEWRDRDRDRTRNMCIIEFLNRNRGAGSEFFICVSIELHDNAIDARKSGIFLHPEFEDISVACFAMRRG